MQVSCGQCGMRYEFDAAEIPAEGYDAQCSNCNHVFFVAPEVPATGSADAFAATRDETQISPRVSVQVAIGCPQCGALYQFDSLDVPDAGYDAQCTQCESVFLVAPHTVSPYEAAPEEAEPMEEADADNDETSFASFNALLSQAEAPAAPQTDSIGGDRDDDNARTMVTRPPQPPVHEAETRVGFAPQLLDGGTFERTDPQMRVPEGYAGARPQPQPQHTVLAEPEHTVPAYRHEPHDDNTRTQVTAPPLMPVEQSRHTVITPPPVVDDTRASEPPAHEPPAHEPQPQEEAAAAEGPSHAGAWDTGREQASAWTNAAEQAERMSAEPTSPVLTLPGPGAQDGRLPTGTLPPDDDGESQRLRTAPMQELAANRRARRARAEAPPPGRGLRIALLVLAVILGCFYMLWQARPDLVTQLLRGGSQTHAVTGEAVTLFEQGKKALLRDTDADYEAAIETFGKALQQDAQFADAQAWQVVGHSLRGADLRGEGARMYAEWEQEQAQWRGLKALERQGSQLSPDQTTKSRQLEDEGPKHLQEATDTLERGGKELSVAQVQAQRARSLLPRSAPVAAAAALCYTETPNDMAVAQSLLAQYSGLAAAGASESPGKTAAPPPDIWLLLAQGRVAATQQNSRDEARAAFAKALEAEPNLTRARWELAQLDVQEGKIDEAKKRYKEILAAVPNHAKSLAAIAALEAAPANERAQGGAAPGTKAPAAGTDAPANGADDLDAAAPPADNDAPDAAATPPGRRFRHRRRPPAAPVAPSEGDDAPANEAPAPVPDDAKGAGPDDAKE